MEKGQLVFDLANIENFNPDDFFISDSNSQVSSLLKETEKWYNGSASILGMSKSGKTHLLNIWSSYNSAALFNCEEINDWNLIISNKNIAIDNFHLLKSDDEPKFLQFYNKLVMNKSKILVAIDPSKYKKIVLKDLESRVNSFTSARINDLDDKLLRVLIIKYFSNAQIIIDNTVIEFIVNRTEREYLFLFSLLETLNYESLKSKNKITIPFVKKFLTSEKF